MTFLKEMIKWSAESTMDKMWAACFDFFKCVDTCSSRREFIPYSDVKPPSGDDVSPNTLHSYTVTPAKTNIPSCSRWFSQKQALNSHIRVAVTSRSLPTFRNDLPMKKNGVDIENCELLRCRPQLGDIEVRRRPGTRSGRISARFLD